MSKRLFLHIGSEKTGTTFLARTLNGAAPHMLRHGILYPGFQAGPAEDHRAIAIASLNGDLKALERELLEIGTEVTENIHTIIISSELFFHLPNVSEYGNEAINIINEWSKGLGFSFEVVAYLRSQEQLIYSLYNQAVKWDSLSLTFQEWVPPILEKYKYDTLMTLWAGHCDKLHAFPYSSDSLGGNIATHFAKAIGIDGDANDLIEKSALKINQNFNPMQSNSGLSIEAINIIKEISRIDPASINAICDTIFAHGDASFYNSNFTEKSIDYSDYLYLKEYYKNSNERLFKQLGMKEIQKFFFIESNFNRTHETSTALTLELLSKLFLRIVAENRTRMFDIADPSPGVLRAADPKMSAWLPRGWCRADTWGAWTLAEEADIVIKTAGKVDWVRLNFDLTAFVTPEHAQEATLCFEEEELAKWFFSIEQPNLSSIVEVDLDPEKPVHTFNLKIPTCRSPRSLGVSLDHRNLGIGLRTIEIITRQS